MNGRLGSSKNSYDNILDNSKVTISENMQNVTGVSPRKSPSWAWWHVLQVQPSGADAGNWGIVSKNAQKKKKYSILKTKQSYRSSANEDHYLKMMS